MNLRNETAKWTQTLQIHWSSQMAYKLHFVLLVVGPTVVFFFVKYNLWSSIYAMGSVEEIRGYDLRAMIAYQVWVMVVAFLGQGYNAMGLAEDIRLGRISSYLIYPFEFWQFHTAGFVAFQVIQLLVAAVTVGTVVALGFVALPSATVILTGTAFASLVGLFWFTVSYSMGLAAFWLEQTWVFRVMFATVSSFLSGAILPLELYPAWLQEILFYSPFPYITYVPARVFMGSYEGSLGAAAGILSIWILLGAGLAGIIWNRGLRLYTAAGM